MSAKPAILPAGHCPGILEAGTDEAGRGCLAGPVYAAAVILPEHFSHPGLTDSKQLSESRRMELANIIRNEAIAWGVAAIDNEEIDRINILQASIKAMHQALKQLQPQPEAVIVDGNRFSPYGNIPWQTFVKGDGRFANIAAASILAKTERDLFMARAAEQFPQYGWSKNKGYPTADHRRAIAQYGPCALHRLSFRLLPPQWEGSLFD